MLLQQMKKKEDLVKLLLHHWGPLYFLGAPLLQTFKRKRDGDR